MNIETYMNCVVDETPTGRSIKNLCTKGRESLKVKFNSAYYLAKRERHFSDFLNPLRLQSMNSVMKIRESYTTDRAAAKFVDVIGKVIRESLKADLEKVR